MKLNKISFEARELTKDKLIAENLVIGSGAGGATVANTLVSNNKEVMMVEEGPELNVEQISKSPTESIEKLWASGGITPFIGNPIMAFGQGRCLGGSTVINGGIFWRTPSFILNHWKQDLKLDDFDEKFLNFYYNKFEKLMNVNFDDRNNTNNLLSNLLEDTSKDLGWKISRAPRAVKNCKNSNLCSAGCPSGAKMSVDKSLIKSISNQKKENIKVITKLKIEKLIHDGSYIKKAIGYYNDRQKINKIEITAKNYFLNSGVINSASILRKNQLSNLAGKKMQFHINLRIMAKFNKNYNPFNATVYTSQIQEFIEQGFTIATSNFHHSYNMSVMSNFDNKEINDYLDNSDYFGSFCITIRSNSYANIINIFKTPFIFYHLKNSDFDLIKFALAKMSKLLFSSGCLKMYLPISKTKPIISHKQFENNISSIKKSDLLLVSVHGMSSNKMGNNPKTSVVDNNSKVWGYRNLFVNDASILPSNIGESPQGSIIPFANYFIDKSLSKKII